MIVAVAAVAGGATYAWVLQTKTVSGVTFSAGSSNLKVDSNPTASVQVWSDGFALTPTENAFLFGKLLAPGAAGGSQIIDIKNVGEIDGTASIRLVLTSNKENTLLAPESKVGDTADPNNSDWDGELAYALKVKISYDPENDGSFVDTGLDYTLAEYNANPAQLTLGAIGHGTDSDSNGIASVKVEWYIPAGVGNNIMSDSVGVNAIFGLE